jgi:death-on-curing protein
VTATVYLSAGQIEDLHRRQLAVFGGLAGLRDRGGLEAAAARPRMTFGGEDLYPDLPAKAGALLHSLVMNHPFVDGNKRTGAMASELFLRANGVVVVASDQELVDLTLAVARGEFSAEALAIWFRQRKQERER